MTKKNLYMIAAALGLAILGLTFGAEITMFLNVPGLLLVVGGTAIAATLAFPRQTLNEVWLLVRGLKNARVYDSEQLVKIFMYMARFQRTRSTRELESASRRLNNRLLALGVSLVADGRRPYEIRERLDQEFDLMMSQREAQRAVLSFMGRLAPAFGLAGTMIGLIRMLHTLNDPASVAQGMSVALLTTFYGLMLANLLILPLERKLAEHNRAEATQLSLIIEGVMGLAAEENGAAIGARLRSNGAYQPGRQGSARAAGRPLKVVWRDLIGLRGLKSMFPHTRSATHEG